LRKKKKKLQRKFLRMEMTFHAHRFRVLRKRTDVIKHIWDKAPLYINEIEHLKRIYVYFFVEKTDFTQLFVPAKHANIYDIEDINKSSYKGLIISKTLNNKAIMMIEEGQAYNNNHIEYYNDYERKLTPVRCNLDNTLVGYSDENGEQLTTTVR
jgi:hypothetical protein